MFSYKRNLLLLSVCLALCPLISATLDEPAWFDDHLQQQNAKKYESKETLLGKYWYNKTVITSDLFRGVSDSEQGAIVYAICRDILLGECARDLRDIYKYANDEQKRQIAQHVKRRRKSGVIDVRLNGVLQHIYKASNATEKDILFDAIYFPLKHGFLPEGVASLYKESNDDQKKLLIKGLFKSVVVDHKKERYGHVRNNDTTVEDDERLFDNLCDLYEHTEEKQTLFPLILKTLNDMLSHGNASKLPYFFDDFYYACNDEQKDTLVRHVLVRAKSMGIKLSSFNGTK